MKLVIALILVLIAVTTTTSAKMYTATMSPGAEVPSVVQVGAGGTFTLNTATFMYTYTYTGISGPISSIHIHGPASTTETAGVLVSLLPALSPVFGSVVLNSTDEAYCNAGNCYINLHTLVNPTGEIRGQLAIATVDPNNESSEDGSSSSVFLCPTAAAGLWIVAAVTALM